MSSISVGIVFCLVIGIFGFILWNQGFLDATIEQSPQSVQDISKTAKEVTAQTTEKLSKTINDQLESPTVKSVEKTFDEVSDKIQKTTEKIPEFKIDIPKVELPDVNIPVPDLPPIENIKQVIPKIQEELPKIQENAKQVVRSELDIKKIELLIHEKINNQRAQQGLSLLELDDQISDIARMHSQDMAKNNYFSHTSLSGKEPWDRGDSYGYETCGTNEAVTLQKKYDELSIQYDKYPQVSTSQSQYQEAMSLYNQLNAISSQLDSLANGGQLFGGLAENIAQNWTSESTTYINGIPIHDWNTEENLAEQTVNGWMNSPGHRENILSGFHSEGIGVAIASDEKVYFTQNFC